MAVEVCQGSPGSGKSAVAVARGILHLKKGGVVAANFSLVDGWAERVVQKTLAFRLCGRWFPDYFRKKARCLHSRWHRVDSLTAIRKIFPLKEAVGVYKDKGKYSEGEGLLLLDEAQLIFNSRKWDKNFEWIEFFTQHRKLHWNVVLIAHDIQMIDSQIRPLAEYESRFRNLQKVRVPIIGLPLVPIPVFLVIKRYAGLGAGVGLVHSRDCFPLPLWAAQLYDSLLVFSADAWGQSTEPCLCGPAPYPVVPLPPRRRLARLSGVHQDQYLSTIPIQ